MSDVRLVIRIPQIEYEHLTNKEKFYSLEKTKREWLINKILNRVIDGAPLPKDEDLVNRKDLLQAEGAYGYVVRYGCNKERLNSSIPFIVYADNKDDADAYINKYVKDAIDKEKYEDDDGNIVNWWWKYYSIDKTPLSEFDGNFVNVVWLKQMNKESKG